MFDAERAKENALSSGSATGKTMFLCFTRGRMMLHACKKEGLAYASLGVQEGKMYVIGQPNQYQVVQINSLINLHHNTFLRLKMVADSYLDRSGYRHVDIAKLMTLANLTFPKLT